jgi:hypothetical protein
MDREVQGEGMAAAAAATTCQRHVSCIEAASLPHGCCIAAASLLRLVLSRNSSPDYSPSSFLPPFPSHLLLTLFKLTSTKCRENGMDMPILNCPHSFSFLDHLHLLILYSFLPLFLYSLFQTINLRLTTIKI